METIRAIKYKITDQRGASAVEFAIILPLLVLFVFGIIEFSILFYDKAVITNASREGARRGILYRTSRVTATEIENAVNNYSSGRLITFVVGSPDPVTTVPSGECENHNDQLTVNVTYQYKFLLIPDFLTAFFSGSFPGTINIEAQTEMRCE